MERIEEFIEALKEKGIRIWSDNEKLRYQAAKGAMDSQTLEKIKEKKVEILEFLNNKSDIEVVFKSNQAERYEPFPLTNIQNSYVIGRNSAYELGDVTCHGYIEITYQEELDKEKGIWQIAGVLGTLLAGGVYLPIDSKQPLQRRNDIIQDCISFLY